VAEISGPERAWHRQVEDQMAQLRVALEQQLADYEQQLNEQQVRMERQQARLEEIADQRASRPGQRKTAGRSHRTGRSASRRAILKWGGAAAAAAAVTLVASEPSVQAAPALPATNGDAIIAGQHTLATSTTNLDAGMGSTANPLLWVSNITGVGDGIRGDAANGAIGVMGAASGPGPGIGVRGAGGDTGIGVSGAGGVTAFTALPLPISASASPA